MELINENNSVKCNHVIRISQHTKISYLVIWKLDYKTGKVIQTINPDDKSYETKYCPDCGVKLDE